MNFSGKFNIYFEEELRKMNVISFKLFNKKVNVNLNEVRFSCALNYIYEGQKGNIGQGDENEALIARFRINNINGKERLAFYKRSFKDDLIVTQKGQFIEIRRRSSLEMPISCYYHKEDDLLRDAPNKKFLTVELFRKYTIQKKFLRDFIGKHNMDSNDFVLVNYSNDRHLYKSILNSMKNDKNKIRTVFSKKVIYDIEDGYEWECPEYKNINTVYDFPWELIHKSKSFAYQCERRIIIVTANICSTRNNDEIIFDNEQQIFKENSDFISTKFIARVPKQAILVPKKNIEIIGEHFNYMLIYSITNLGE